MAFSYVTALHNRLARSGEQSYISYDEYSEGPAHTTTWTASCKFRDEVKGVGKGPTKIQAREGAAKQALEKMGFQI
ncbi:hypothetical protein Agabi119p4_1182 [Agaricus bisporus var. burnettii]|uniref:DRBM domain-containing protein n=1 Tax=Agaricus bisporus var. burnettii TaxID=192524 RepID=A0A8H7FBZ8_AGABI|nr:hypothetical protein Agabi119p4_1182 [Agaricus bisporus var. burnettii]